ncbi:hypothetical protein VKT23_004479 [Stygiomarasmius scandens]|uniref:DDE-1 domain-containing protein n=1 Tax=Marasmiellus scandens TaxID=2682957 RepID=A0ABR1JUT3_9AGAR
MVAIFTEQAPELFDLDVGKKKTRLGWSLRSGTRTAQKLPENYSELLLEAFLREATVIRDYQIPASLRVNTDQTQSVLQPGTGVTWNKKGEKQVDIAGKDEKRAFTLVPSISASGEVLPMQAIFQGQTQQSCPSKGAAAYQEARALGFLLEPSCTDTYWSTLDTMKNLVNKVIAPYFEAKKAEILGLSDEDRKNQFSLWKIDCWSVHRSEEFLTWMKKTHQNIIVLFVPSSCTGIFQPLDVGIQRVLKLSIKRAAHRDVVTEVRRLLKERSDDKAVVKMDVSMPTLRDRSLGWIVQAYDDISKPELVKKAFELCRVPDTSLNLSHKSLTSPEAMKMLRELPKTNPKLFAQLTRDGVEPHTYHDDSTKASKQGKSASKYGKGKGGKADAKKGKKNGRNGKAAQKMPDDEAKNEQEDGEPPFAPDYEDDGDIPLDILCDAVV